MTTKKKSKPKKTVEHEPGWGWIARDSRTGLEVIPDFRWRTRSVARDVVKNHRVSIRVLA